MVILTGCSSLNLRDNLSDVGATGATIGCSILTGGNVPLCATVGVGTGVTINTVTGEPEEIKLEQVTNVHQEEVAKTSLWTEAVKSLGIYGTIGAIVFFGILPIITGWLGVRRPRREEHEAKAQRDIYQRMVEKRVEE